jgi:hypothetical protein
MERATRVVPGNFPSNQSLGLQTARSDGTVGDGDRVVLVGFVGNSTARPQRPTRRRR